MESGKAKNYAIVILVVVFVLVGANWIMGNKSSAPTGNTAFNGASDSIQINTVLKGFKYNPDSFTVKRGQQVTLTIKNEDGVNHGLHLPQFGVVSSIPKFTTKTVTFTAIETPSNGQAVPTCSQEHGETLTISVV